MTRYMLDTNIVSHVLKKHSAVTERLIATPMNRLCVSAITEGELLLGLARRPAATRLRLAVTEFLSRVEVLPWDRAAAQQYGLTRAAMAREGRVIAPMDLLIATHALSIDAVLVTNDHAVKQMSMLHIEDWTS